LTLRGQVKHEETLTYTSVSSTSGASWFISKALKRKLGIWLVGNLRVDAGEHSVANTHEQVCSAPELADTHW
jgi:hypothetical protein